MILVFSCAFSLKYVIIEQYTSIRYVAISHTIVCASNFRIYFFVACLRRRIKDLFYTASQ
jgi:hypothetical protein